ncbi:hypothetical protein HDU93_008154 [Gonapodya sp. JEL0774]|nr:hypothetical protein HDU93_008154 [Gonapodya sp. JEL0774]
MGEQLLSILARLAKENLQPPSAPTVTALPQSHVTNGPESDDWTIVANPDNARSSSVSLDEQTRREDDERDDMLFFVKRNRSPPSEGGALIVRRKVSTSMPSLPEPVDWKATFWLNVVLQCVCRLTVTVCHRETVNEDGGDLKDGGPKNSTGSIGSDAKDDGSKRRAVMIPLRRISRKVYPSAYRTNMAFKESAHEPCFPHVYFTQLNFQDSELHLDVCPGEWLCVELAILLPGGGGSSIGGSANGSPIVGRRGVGVAGEGLADVDAFYDLPMTSKVAVAPLLRRASTSSPSLLDSNPLGAPVSYASESPKGGTLSRCGGIHRSSGSLHAKVVIIQQD